MSQDISTITQEVQDPFIDGVIQNCKKCDLPIYEGHAYELGDDRWHIDCFKCSKCNSSLGCNSNFLVLGNGNLICSNCSYNCKQCGKKIDDLAILTGDQAYCSSCFKCRSCKRKIEDLRYARTSKGLFCMSCHEKLMAKKKKYDLKKKHQLQMKLDQERQHDRERERDQVNDGDQELADNTSNYSRTSKTSKTSKTSNRASSSTPNSALLTPNLEMDLEEKPLHQPKAQPASLLQSQTDLYDLYDRSRSPTPKLSKHSSTNELYKQLTTSSSSALSREKELPLTPESRPAATKNQLHNLRNENNTTPVNDDNNIDNDTTPKGHPDVGMRPSQPNHPIERDYSIEEIYDSDDELNQRDRLKQSSNDFGNGSLQPALDLRHPGSNNNNASTNLSPHAGSQDQANMLESPTSISHTKFQGKDVLIMSPRQDSRDYPDNKSIDNLQEINKDANNTHVFTHSRNRSNNDNTLQVDHQARQSGTKSPDLSDRNGLMVESRSNCPSPLARANRHARVLETNDGNNEVNDPINDPIEEKFQDQASAPAPESEFSTPKKKGFSQNNPNLSSPPPRVPLPSVPVGFGTPNSNHSRHQPPTLQPYHGHIKTSSQSSDQYFMEKATSDDFLNGLGLEGVQYNDHNDLQRGNNTPQLKGSRVIMNPSPTVTNLEESVPQVSPASNGDNLGRKSSIIRTPKLGLKHKRSISGGSAGGSANSSISKLNIFRGRDDRGHSRHVSDGSISGSYTYVMNNNFKNVPNTNGEQYFTPPLPSTYRSDYYHNRSNSDSIGNPKHFDLSDLAKFDSQIKSLQSDVQKLDSQKHGLVDEIGKLSDDKYKLNSDLDSIRIRYAEEYKQLTELRKEVSELKAQKVELEKYSPELEDAHPSIIHHQQPQQNQTDIPSQTSSQGQTLVSNMSNQKSNSSSSLLNNPPEINDENVEPQKATKLKFWRRAKIGFNSAGPANMYGNGQSNTGNNNLSVPNSGSINSTAPSPQRQEEGKGGFGLMSKSRSTNILDSFLNNNNHNDNDNDSVSLFNCSIEKRAKYENSSVPLIISRCVKEVEDRGLDIEGIYRISGGNLTIISIEQAFSNYSFNGTAREDTKQVNRLNEVLDCDINAVTSALKRYLRKIPDPLIPYEVYNEFIKLNSITSNTKKIGDFKVKVIDKLPGANRQVLYLLCKHLELVNSYSSINRMNYKNLSVVFAPTIARDETGEREMMDMGNRNDITEFLLNNYTQIFN